MKTRKILILKFSALGDVVHTLPVAATIRKSLPDSYIAWMVEERYQDLLLGNPDVDEVIPLRTKVWRKNWNSKSLFEILHTIKTLRRQNFDLVLDLHGLLKSGIIARLSGAPTRIGFHQKKLQGKNQRPVHQPESSLHGKGTPCGRHDPHAFANCVGRG